MFGPRQNPKGAYAAVIPLFITNMLKGDAPVINGDGSFSRDFTYISNVVDANLKAIFTNNADAINQIYNIACGEQTTLLKLFEYIASFLSFNAEPRFEVPRIGDIPHSLASIMKAQTLLSYTPQYSVKEGLELTVKWHQQKV